MEILAYFLRVEPFLTRISMPTFRVVKTVFLAFLGKQKNHLLPATGNKMGSLKTIWREFEDANLIFANGAYTFSKTHKSFAG